MESYKQSAYKFSDFLVKSPELKMVDLTGAGDAFIAGFSVGLLESESTDMENVNL